MGKVALQEFPIILDTMEKLDRVLSKLEPKPTFNLVDVLLLSDTNSLIHNAEVTQPLCTAIQIALIDLFSQWDIMPQVSVGHSSGEIGAAYSAGLISAPEAIIAAFCRGRAVAAHSTPGAMLAVGLGADEVQPFLDGVAPDDISIACENSPTSVTLSGRDGPIEHLRKLFNENDIFARALPTGRAYHSPHMANVGTAYESMLSEAMALALTENDLLWCRPRSKMISSVTAAAIPADLNHLPDGYWSANLRQRVLFNTAVQLIPLDDDLAGVTCMVEIGCHSALAGPFKQIRKAVQGADRLTYVASMSRNKNDAEQLLSVAGSLFTIGYPVDLAEVNNNDFAENYGHRVVKTKPKTRNLLVDLPPYQWNYDKKYWAEPRASAEQRGRVYPRHDLLGSRVSGLSSGIAVWRNVLRQRDIPWLKDHNVRSLLSFNLCLVLYLLTVRNSQLGGTAIFPAAGHLSLAIEGLRQMHETAGLPFDGVTLRDVDIKTALVVPENDEGVEIVIRLLPETSSTTPVHAIGGNDGPTWYSWSVESLPEQGESKTWTTHCEGKISSRTQGNQDMKLPLPPVDESAMTQRVSGKRWYDAFHRVGFNYGKAFNHLQHARTDRAVHHATGDVTICVESNTMDGESRYLVHPSTIDACLQLIIISIHSGRHREMPWGVVPSRIEEVVLLPAQLQGTLEETGHAVAWTDGFEGRKFNTNVRLSGADQKILMDVKNLTCIKYEAALPASDEAVSDAAMGPFSIVSWKPDIVNLRDSDFHRLYPDVSEAGDCLAKLAELISHHCFLSNVLIVSRTTSSQKLIDNVLKTLPPSTSITIGIPSEEHKPMPYDNMKGRVTTLVLPEEVQTWADATRSGNFNLVLVEKDMDPSNLLPLVTERGWLLGTADIATPSPSSAEFTLQVGRQYVLRTKASGLEVYNNGVGPSSITVLSATGLDEVGAAFVDELAISCPIIKHKPMAHFDEDEDLCVVIDDTTGDVSGSMLVDATAFTSVKKVLTSSDTRTLWLTRGIRQGAASSNVAAGTAEGLLRVLRSEQAAAKIALLDVDVGEDTTTVAAAVAKLAYAETKNSGKDNELWLRNGVLHSSRVHVNDSLMVEKGQDNVRDVTLSGSLQYKTKSAEGGFIFEHEAQLSDLRLVDDQVEISVLASQWPSSVPGSQLLVAGTVTRAGSSVDEKLVGKRAVAFAYDGMPTMLRTRAFAVLEDNEIPSPEQLVGLLSSLVPLVHLCIVHAKLGNGEVIVSLPGPEGTIETLERLSEAMDWKLTVTSGVPSDGLKTIRQKCEESASGAVTVLAHDFSSNFSQEAWRFIPSSCRFLLLNELPANVGPDPLPFMRGASFIPNGIKSLRLSTKTTSKVLAQALGLIKAHPKFLAATSIDVVDVQDAREHPNAPHSAETPNSSTTIVRFRPGQSQVKVIPKARQLLLSSEDTYLLVGCLGGLGRSLSRFMMERGARHFAFLSRSGADKPEAAHLVKDIQRAGAEALVFRADASSEEGVKRVVSELQANRPIRGVVHAAMVLKVRN